MICHTKTVLRAQQLLLLHRVYRVTNRRARVVAPLCSEGSLEAPVRSTCSTLREKQTIKSMKLIDICALSIKKQGRKDKPSYYKTATEGLLVDHVQLSRLQTEDVIKSLSKKCPKRAWNKDQVRSKMMTDTETILLNGVFHVQSKFLVLEDSFFKERSGSN